VASADGPVTVVLLLLLLLLLLLHMNMMICADVGTHGAICKAVVSR
jgi:hypothetical protein